MLHLQLLATLNATSRRSSDGANGTSASLTAGDCQAWETFGKDTLYKAILAPNWTPYSSGRTHALVHSGAGLAGPFPSQLLDREDCRMLLLQYYSNVRLFFLFVNVGNFSYHTRILPYINIVLVNGALDGPTGDRLPAQVEVGLAVAEN